MKIMLIKALVFTVLILFFGASIIPSTVGINEEEHNSTNNTTSFIAKETMDTTTVSVDPPSQTVSSGETFTVDIFCDPSQQIKSFELKLSFDPLLLQANSVTEGGIFGGYFTYFNSGTIDNNAGSIVDIYGIILGSGNVSNPGTLVNILLTAKSTIGSSLLNLYDVGVTNETEYVPIIVNDGNVTIQGAYNTPNKPNVPSGPTVREIGQAGSYSTSATDPDGDQVQYRFDWNANGGNFYSSWTTLSASGHTNGLSHSWDYAGTYVIKAQARDEHGYESVWSDPHTVVVSPSGENQPPDKPSTLSGPISGKTGREYSYHTMATDPDGDQLFYQWNWGDGSFSQWLGPYDSGEEISASHSWSEGSYNIRVKAKDAYDFESQWSDPLGIVMPNNKGFQTMFLQYFWKLLERFSIFNFF
jgi:hypothetical protein